MRIKPFRALRPADELSSKVASVPYDVVTTEEAREMASDNDVSFLHVVRAEIDLSPGESHESTAVYSKAASSLGGLIDRGVLLQDPEPGVYVYRLSAGAHSQFGIVTCCHVDDYAANVIKKHEKTREDKERDRARHVAELNANTGPVLLQYRDKPEIDSIVAGTSGDDPLFDFEAPDGVRHTGWRVRDVDDVVDAFAGVDAAYIADGHHRAASAWRVAEERRASGQSGPGSESDWFLGVLFPVSQLRIMAYNRCVRDLNGLGEDEFLKRAGELFDVTEAADGKPESAGHARLYVGSKWYDLAWDTGFSDDPVASLDVSVLQDRLLGPVLGIEDPRREPRIDFVGGIHGPEGLKRIVDSEQASAAFSLWPVQGEQIMAVSDAGLMMPPKSTWFEPKLRSGLFVHLLQP